MNRKLELLELGDHGHAPGHAPGHGDTELELPGLRAPLAISQDLALDGSTTPDVSGFLDGFWDQMDGLCGPGLNFWIGSTR